MKKTILLCFAMLAAVGGGASAQKSATVSVHVDEGTRVIPKEIYGQFAEHLGTLVYGGLWVGENSSIPNIDGYRTDVFNALKALKVPVLRWPGGCFADTYHWMDGIGPRENRPLMVNTHWGGTIEDNSFGTHEFLNFCELLGCEPYVSVNVGSGSVEEMAKWIEYMTAEGDSPMARLRRENGREDAWNIKYIGVGNENWGCGGNMTPEYYSDIYRRYATYARSFGSSRIYKVACGANAADYNWTKVLMQRVGRQMDGLSLHYYSVAEWNNKGSATQFDTEGFYSSLATSLKMEEIIQKNMEIMDEYDPQRRIGLLVDEWGTWWNEEPGTVAGHLHQQNTMRDAFVAALNLDIFHKYTERIKMANIAQIVNVLQAMILTDKEGGMILTPTYHVFRMYNVHQDATYLPVDVSCDFVEGGSRPVPMLSATASRNAEGVIHLSISNVDAADAQTVTVNLPGVKARSAVGEILTSGALNDHNTFENPDKVAPVAFRGAKIEKGVLTVTLPAASIVTLELR